jgi:excisionase family DNA binding protein
MKPDLSQYVSAKEAAQIMGVNHRYGRKLCSQGKLASVRFGRVFLVVRKAAEAYQRDPCGRGRPKA